MAIHNPPQYRYALYDQWDKDTFDYLAKLGKTKSYPKIIGSPRNKNQFLKTLIRTQKSLNDWRNMLRDIIQQAKDTKSIDCAALNKKYPSEGIGKNVPAWVTYDEDKTVNDFIDGLGNKSVDFIGSDAEISEFVMRFILGQLGHDWEQTIMMIWEMLGDDNKLSLNVLNSELKNFDYQKIFK